MELLVDFNMREPDGRIPALLVPGHAEALAPGESVVAYDGEGLQCAAVVDEISANGRYVMLQTRGRLRRDSTL